MVSIIGGKYKRSNILVPSNGVRPTSSLKREAIFSILESDALKEYKNPYKNKCFIDFYAGSGAMGIEAISRGGNFCYFYENNMLTIDTLQKNCSNICKGKNYIIISEDINKMNMSVINQTISTIFIDPPYDINPFFSILNKIKNIVHFTVDSKVIIECHKNTTFDIIPEFNIVKEKKFGKTKVLFLKLKNKIL